LPHVRVTVALPSEADMCSAPAGPLRAISGLMQRNQTAYWITSSARASSVGGTVSPNAFAVWRLTTRRNFTGRPIGKSAGFAPFRILSTKPAARPPAARVRRATLRDVRLRAQEATTATRNRNSVATFQEGGFRSEAAFLFIVSTSGSAGGSITMT
jgi:hypothetical protein